MLDAEPIPERCAERRARSGTERGL
jgi:hypothetical protein